MKRLLALVLIVAMLLAGASVALAQGGSSGGNALNLPPPPEKPQPNMQYGNTARADLIGEGLSQASGGNANVYVTENDAINVKVVLLQDGNPYQMAPTMANLTYMLVSLYSLTEKPNSDVVMKVYDTSNNLIIDSRFNTAKNAFDYFTIPEGAATQPGAQPGMQQPGMGRQPQVGRQPLMGGQPGYGGSYPMR